MKAKFTKSDAATRAHSTVQDCHEATAAANAIHYPRTVKPPMQAKVAEFFTFLRAQREKAVKDRELTAMQVLK